MDQILFEAREADKNDPEVVAIIRKNEMIAKAAMREVMKRLRKKDPEEAFGLAMNVIGILAANFVRDAEEIGGFEMAETVAGVIEHHIESALRMPKEFDA